MKSGSDMERATATASLSGSNFAPVVDLLIRGASMPDDLVRAQSVGALAQVTGDDAGRACRAVVAALDDTAANVRWNAAMGIEFGCGTARHVAPLLDRIAREEHPVAMHAMVHAVLALDPAGGRQRVTDTLASAPAPVRKLGEDALARKPAAKPFQLPKVSPPAAPTPPTGTPPTGTPPPAPAKDDTTRAYLQRLGEEILGMPESKQREEQVVTFAQAHADYLRRTRNSDMLPIIRRLMDRSTSGEQRSLMSAMGRSAIPAISDQLILWTKHTDGTVRAAAAHALALMSGKAGTRGRAAVIALLDDEDTHVRLQVAFAIRLIGDAEAAKVLIARLEREPEYSVVYAIVLNALAIDPKTRTRMEEAAETMPTANAQLVRKALAAQTR